MLRSIGIRVVADNDSFRVNPLEGRAGRAWVIEGCAQVATKKEDGVLSRPVGFVADHLATVVDSVKRRPGGIAGVDRINQCPVGLAQEAVVIWAPLVAIAADAFV